MDTVEILIFLGFILTGVVAALPIGFYVGFRAGRNVSREPPEMPTVVRRAKRRLKDLEDKDALEAEIIEEQKI